MTYAETIATGLRLRPTQVAATIELLDAGNTIPFIARYRKERTAGLDEEQLRQVSAALVSLRALDERRATVIATLEEQGTLTPELRERLHSATTRTELEDLYQPYKPK
ncbi:MAG TPA: Tex-like N-terminal domain-containing protein, partial [Herpetosiphonaceae bacterium]|nr:Tex-like N-terminal domain-containing protein [Herpetosiphonaceae bacterium]